jgi:hypothetical protein
LFEAQREGVAMAERVWIEREREIEMIRICFSRSSSKNQIEFGPNPRPGLHLCGGIESCCFCFGSFLVNFKIKMFE